MKNKKILIALLLSTAFLILFLGCRTDEGDSDSNSNATALNKATSLTTTDITSTSVTLSWTAPTSFGKAADGTTVATLADYTVYYVAGKTVTINTAGVATKEKITATSVIIVNLTEETEYAFIVVTTNSEGKTSTSDVLTVSTSANSSDINFNTYNLSYNILTNATYGTEKIYPVNSSTIPEAANATYSISAKDKTSKITGITMDGSDIRIANTTTADTYNLTVTASPTSIGYTGTTTANITIIIEKKPINSYTLTYDTSEHAIVGTEKIYVSTKTIPVEASAAYDIALQAGGTAPPSIIMDGSNIKVANTTTADTYNLTVTATTNSTNYTGTLTQDVSITVELPSSKATAPSEATALTTTDITSNSVTLSWTAPSNTGKADDGSTATLSGYDVYYAEGATATTSDTKATTVPITASTSFIVSNLDAFQDYAFIVVTTNSANKASTSANVTSKTLSAATAPSEATALTTTNITSNSVTLSWTAPSNTGKADDGSTATLSGYDVYYAEGATATTSDTKATTVPITASTSFIVSNLDAFQDYAFIVVTTNSANKASTSANVTSKTLSAATAPSEATALTTTDITSNSVTLSWTAPSNTGKADDGSTATLSGYDVYYAEGATATTSDTKATTVPITASTSFIVSNLDAFQDYAFIVVTTNSANKASTSANVTSKTLSAATAPSEATALTTTNITSNSVTLSWTAPSNTGKADDGSTATLSGYDVYYAEGATATTSDTKATTVPITASTSFIVSNLDAFQDYAFIVVTTNSANKASTSANVTSKTLSAATAPSEATALTTTNITSDSVTLSWTIPSNMGKVDDGSTATLSGYDVYYAEGATATTSDTKATTVPITASTSFIVSNLDAFQDYAFIVVTTNSANKASTSANVTTKTLSAATAPSEATALTTTNITSDSITLSWTIPSNMGKVDDGSTATLSGYDVYYAEGATATTSDTKATTVPITASTSFIVSNLTADTSYAFIVVTTNNANKTSTSDVKIASTTVAASKDLAQSILTYPATTITYNQGTTIDIETNTIPNATNNVEYTLSSGTSIPTDISIDSDSGRITVATTTPANTYTLTVTASPTAAGTNVGYTNNKEAIVTITINKININTYAFTFLPISREFNDSAIYAPRGSSPPFNVATYTIELESGGALTGVSLVSTGFARTANYLKIESNTPIGAHNLKITATATDSNYTGTYTTSTSLTITKIRFSSFYFSYQSHQITHQAGTTINHPQFRTSVPNEANPTYTLNSGTTSVPAGITLTDTTTLTIADTTPIGLYNIKLTIAANHSNYDDTTILIPLTITVENNMDGYVLTYPNQTARAFDNDIELAPTVNTIPNDADVTYSVVAKKDNQMDENVYVMFKDRDEKQPILILPVYAFTKNKEYIIYVTATPNNPDYVGKLEATFTVEVQ